MQPHRVPTILHHVEDKPVVISEWCQSTPNEWKAEAAPLALFYGMGLSGWDALIHFAGSTPRMGSGWPWNLRAQYSADGSQLLAIGGPPLMLEPVQATITLRGAPVISARVVDVHGVPTSQDVAMAGNTVTIDGRYQTYYYEFRRQAVVPTCLCRTQATSRSPLTPPATVLFLAAPGPDGVSLDPSAPLAQVPYACPFAPGDADPDPVLAPGGSPLVFYQVSSPSPVTIRLTKDVASSTIRFAF